MAGQFGLFDGVKLGYHPFRFKDDSSYISGMIVLWGSRSAGGATISILVCFVSNLITWDIQLITAIIPSIPALSLRLLTLKRSNRLA